MRRLGALSAGEVPVLLLRDMLDLGVDETARLLETTPGTVRVLHHRARAKAREPAEPAAGLRATERFLHWLLARTIVGLLVRTAGSPTDPDPGWTAGVLEAHAKLLDAMVAVAREAGETVIEVRTRQLRAEVYRLRGRRTELLADFDDLYTLARAAGLPVEAARAGVALVKMQLGRYDEARAGARALLTELRGAPDPRTTEFVQDLVDIELQHASTHGQVDQVASMLGDLDERELPPGSGLTIGSLRARAMGLIALRRFEEAERLLEEALEMARASGHRYQQARLLNQIASSLGERCEFDGAIARFEAAREVCRSFGDEAGQALCESLTASMALLRGEIEPAAERLANVLPIVTAQGQLPVADTVQLHLGVAELVAGRPVRARRAFEGCIGSSASWLRNFAGMYLAVLEADAGHDGAGRLAAIAERPLIATERLALEWCEQLLIDPAEAVRRLAEAPTPSPELRLAEIVVRAMARRTQASG